MKNGIKSTKTMDWIITLRPRFVRAFLNGDKRIEVRRRLPLQLRVGDGVYVVEKGSGGKIMFYSKVTGVIYETKPRFWEGFKNVIGLEFDEYKKYLDGKFMVYGLDLHDIKLRFDNLYCRDLGIERPPQWFTKVICEHAAP